jgi:hypothetical protein
LHTALVAAAQAMRSSTGQCRDLGSWWQAKPESVGPKIGHKSAWKIVTPSIGIQCQIFKTMSIFMSYLDAPQAQTVNNTF